MFATVEIDQLQGRYIAWLAVRLPVEEQSQAMFGLQARLDLYFDNQVAVVGADGLLVNQVSRFQCGVNGLGLMLGWFAGGQRRGCRRWRREAVERG
ncbi:hypothetical protein D3C75_1223510 [compost metagenome]